MTQKAPYKKGDLIRKNYDVYYKVYDVLGMGGFGIVYLVYSHETKSAFALKTFRDEYLEDITTRERFKKECQVWIDLERHPYLVRAYFVHEISGRLFIATEYIAPNADGMNTLDAYLRRSPPDLAQSLRWAIQFCHGMEYAYSKGIKAHRDIKPANILIDQNKTIKISDFGLAGVISTLKPLSGIKINPQQNISGGTYQTIEGTAFGTPPYMPPEQFVNAAVCDERSDIYSFGIVLYQMASGGKLPFLPDLPRDNSEKESMRFWQEMYRLHCQSPVLKINSPLFPIIQKCLEKEQKKRYQSFKELRADLELILKQLTGEVIKLPELKELTAWEWNSKALSLHNLGMSKKAIAYFDKALEIDPNSSLAWSNKGIALNALGKYQEAIACYGRALEINPIYALVWNNKGNALKALGKYQEAIACYGRALEINPRLAEAWNNKGVALRYLGKPQEAIACYDRALEINPIYVDAWNNKGFALKALGKYQEAIVCYDRALEINPIYALAWNNKGIALFDLGKPQKAISCYDRALEINPRLEEAWINKGAAFGSLCKYQEAIACSKKAIEINPREALAWFNKGAAEDYLRLRQAAILSYKRFMNLNPSQYAEQIKYALQRLRILEGELRNFNEP